MNTPPVKRVFLLACQQNGNNVNFLSILRADDETWGLPGGKVEKNESPMDAIQRETFQEIGLELNIGDIEISYSFEPVKDVGCTVYMAKARADFIPKLNSESLAFKWAALDNWPTPAHPQMQRVIDENKDGFTRQARDLSSSTLGS